MGQYRITIEGTGSHHNDHGDNDADLVARNMVAILLDKGHAIRSACFEVGFYDENKIYQTNTGEDLLDGLPTGADGYIRQRYLNETNKDEGAESL